MVLYNRACQPKALLVTPLTPLPVPVKGEVLTQNGWALAVVLTINCKTSPIDALIPSLAIAADASPVAPGFLVAAIDKIDYANKKLVVFFYPAASTPGCTTEACNLRDNYSVLTKKGYVVIGVSPDDELLHQKFIAKNKLPFNLIADTDKEIIDYIKKKTNNNYDIKKITPEIIYEEDVSDHEVAMGMGQLDDIIRNANELKGKIGTDEINLPAWVQDHISQAQNFINQANTGYHKLKPNK